MIRIGRQDLISIIVLTAAGVVLATGFVHVLPDANSALSNTCLNFNTDYPWAFAIAAFAALITLSVEVAFEALLRSRMEPPKTNDLESTVRRQAFRSPLRKYIVLRRHAVLIYES
jgi:hypothetical protein